MNQKLLSTLGSLALLAAPAAHAALTSVEAFDNATVQPAGPRSGTSGKNFFNVEGSANGNFASYGVLDFSYGSLPQMVADVNGLSLSFVQDVAGFTTSGSLLFSLDLSATLADIQPGGSSPLVFDGSDPGTAGDVTAGDLSLLSLGGGTFTEGTDGDVDTFTLTLDAAAQTALATRLNNNQTIRIVVGTGDAAVAATWAGFSNSSLDGPTLTVDYTPVPEPAVTAGLTALGCAGLALLRRLKHR